MTKPPKEHDTRTPRKDVTPRNVPICSSFAGDPGDPVNWTGNTAGCVICQNQPNIPFTPGFASNGSGQYCLTLPAPAQVSINSNCPAGQYNFNVSCCSNEALKTVTVS